MELRVRACSTHSFSFVAMLNFRHVYSHSLVYWSAIVPNLSQDWCCSRGRHGDGVIGVWSRAPLGTVSHVCNIPLCILFLFVVVLVYTQIMSKR